MQKDSQTVHAHPSWKDVKLRQHHGGLVPAGDHRFPPIGPAAASRCPLEYLNSYAAVYVDGKKAGEMRFPGGEVDLTSLCRPGGTHRLSLLVVAMPLKGVMLSYTDTASAREVKGSVARRGLCGDVYLVSTPAGPRIADVKVDTSVRKKELTLRCGARRTCGGYTVRLSCADHEGWPQHQGIHQHGHSRGSDLKEGRIAFTEEWMPDKLWDIHTPQNTYDLEVSLLDAGGKVLDTCLAVRFGFREFWIDGRDFYLNGTRIFLSAVPLDNAQVGAALANYEAARESLERLKSFGINFVYTHNYGCEPGSHLSFAEILRAADDVGMLVSFSQPHFSHYDWQAPDADQNNGYARHAEFYVRAAQNHPSVVMYSMSHNATGYNEDMNPDMIDGIQDARDTVGLEERQARVAGRGDRQAPGPMPHRLSSRLGQPRLDARDQLLPELRPDPGTVRLVRALGDRRASSRSSCANTARRSPGTGRCTAGGTRANGSSAARSCRGSSAWPSGTRSSSGTGPSRSARWRKRICAGRPSSSAQGKLWHRWDYPHQLGSTDFPERYPVFAMYYTDNWRAFRTWGVSANSPWEHAHPVQAAPGRGQEPQGGVQGGLGEPAAAGIQPRLRGAAL